MISATQHTKRKSGYLPSLDGWRALAILGVLMTHDVAWNIGGHSNASYKGIGGYGVQLFFAISGVLITTRILEEESLVGFFDLRRFYIRRIFRIQPAAMGYLAVTGLLIAFGVIHDHWFFWLGAVFFFENFAYRGLPLDAGSFFSGHFWTLAVEEHFYILLSLLLFCVRKYRLAVLVIIYVILVKAQEYALWHGMFPAIVQRRTYWQLHYLVFPAAFAVALQKPRVKKWANLYLRPWAAGSFWIAMFLLHTLVMHHRDPRSSVFSLQSLLGEADFHFEIFVTFLLGATMLHPKAWSTRFLEIPPLRFIGKISYSLYLWHVLFFSRIFPETNVTNSVLLALSNRPAKYLATCFVATLSYYALEKPMMRLGHRLAPPALPGRPELAEESVSANTSTSCSQS
ncbi:MAG TPA: acyltransferase [Granulicella sp.]